MDLSFLNGLVGPGAYNPAALNAPIMDPRLMAQQRQTAIPPQLAAMFGPGAYNPAAAFAPVAGPGTAPGPGAGMQMELLKGLMAQAAAAPEAQPQAGPPMPAIATATPNWAAMRKAAEDVATKASAEGPDILGALAKLGTQMKGAVEDPTKAAPMHVGTDQPAALNILKGLGNAVVASPYTLANMAKQGYDSANANISQPVSDFFLKPEAEVTRADAVAKAQPEAVAPPKVAMPVMPGGESKGTGPVTLMTLSAGDDPKAPDLTPYLEEGRDPKKSAALDPKFATNIASMIDAAPDGIRNNIKIGSSVRDEAEQKVLWDDAVKKYGSEAEARKWVAPPGKSYHNKGAAIDLKYGSPEAQAWVQQNAAAYGLKFPMANEPWHIEPADTRGKGGNYGLPAPPVLQPFQLPNAPTIAAPPTMPAPVAQDFTETNAYLDKMAPKATDPQDVKNLQFQTMMAGLLGGAASVNASVPGNAGRMFAAMGAGSFEGLSKGTAAKIELDDHDDNENQRYMGLRANAAQNQSGADANWKNSVAETSYKNAMNAYEVGIKNQMNTYETMVKNLEQTYKTDSANTSNDYEYQQRLSELRRPKILGNEKGVALVQSVKPDGSIVVEAHKYGEVNDAAERIEKLGKALGADSNVIAPQKYAMIAQSGNVYAFKNEIIKDLVSTGAGSALFGDAYAAALQAAEATVPSALQAKPVEYKQEVDKAIAAQLLMALEGNDDWLTAAAKQGNVGAMMMIQAGQGKK